MQKKRYWWSGLPGERYWCEITDRERLGSDLLCPQTDEGGKPYWSYTLIQQIQPGDIVFHYHTPEKAFLGASVAAGPAVSDTMTWVPHGTVGRRKAEHVPSRPAWRLPLREYVAAHEPLSLEEIQNDESWVRQWISEKQAIAEVVASPFQPYPGKLRGFQSYLTKMPLDFVNRWFKLRILADQLSGSSYVSGLVRELQDEDAVLQAVVEEVRQHRGQGFSVSPKARRAIEECAMRRARQYYENQGFAVEVRGKPYDLLCSKGSTILYVEVKGTATAGKEVLLTPNEVAFANEHSTSMALFVVSELHISSEDPPEVTGGTEVEIKPWIVEPERLWAIGYSYALSREHAASAL